MAEIELQPMPNINEQAVEVGRNYALTMAMFLLLKSLRDAVQSTATAAEMLTMTTSDVVPTADDIPDGQFTVWKNTTTPDVRLYVNDAGTFLSVELLP